MDDKLQKKGKLVESEKGELVLVNDDKQGFRAGKDVIAIWNRCEGNVTGSELVEEISEISDQSKKEIQKAIDKIVNELKEINLLEVSR